MIVSLEVLYRREEIRLSMTLDWVPGPRVVELLIDVNPLKIPPDWIVDGTMTSFARWHQHQFFFRFPKCRDPGRSMCIPPVAKWESGSTDSDAQYPWWWNLDGYDIILQILPGPGQTSPHHHKLTKIEDYVPLDNHDTQTKIVLDDEEPVSLIEPIRVLAGCRHHLIREASGFSMQLLRMCGPVRFPDRSDHIRER